MTSLPSEAPNRLRNIAHVVSAYNICLRLEKPLQSAVDRGEDIGDNLIFVQILGYLIHDVPTDRGLKNVVQEIISCIDDSALLNVGKMYYDHYFRACAFLNLLVQQRSGSNALTSSNEQGPHTNTL